MASDEREDLGFSNDPEEGRISTPLENGADNFESNGHHPQQDDGLSYEEQLQFAGVDPDEDDELVTTEDLIDGPSTAKERGAENSPLSRTGLVAIGLGGVVLVIWILSGLFGGGEQVAEDTESPLPEETASTFDESDRYKAELALIEQDEAQQETRIARTEGQPSQNNEENENEEEPTQPEEPRVVRASPSPPPPTPTRAAPSPPPPPPQTIAVPASSSPPAPQQEEVDPLEQWAQLASIGSIGAETALIPEPEFAQENTTDESTAGTAQATLPVPQSPPTLDPSAVNPSATQNQFPFPSARIGDNPVPLPNESPQRTTQVSPQRTTAAIGSGRQSAQLVATTPGTQGILAQRSISEMQAEEAEAAIAASAQRPTIKQVAIGSSAQGEVTVPVVFAGGNPETRGRFAIKLTEPLQDVNGEIALDAGTIFITEISEALNANILRQEVVAIVYEDSSGQIRQEAVESGVLIIRGNGNEPLVARVENRGGRTFGQNLLVGTLNAIGNVGAVVNAPDAVTTATSGATGNDTSTSTSTTVTSGGEDSVLAAALNGFFTPLAESVAQDFETQNQQTQPYLIVEQGKEVSIFVNGLLEVVQ